MTTTTKRTSSKPTTTAAERETAAQERTEKLEALQASLAEQVEALATSEGWAEMLKAASRFTRYSLGNVLLLHRQLSLREMDTSSRVAGFQTWRGLGRVVRKGERGLAILAPCTYSPKADDKHDDQGVKPAEDSTADKRRILRGFRVVHVFAECQTDGVEIPDIRPKLLPGEAPEGLWDALSGLVAAEGYAVERGDCSGANGYTDQLAKVVRIRDDVSESQATKTLAHELAHVLLHCTSYDYAGCRDGAEIEAESVAFIVCAASGLDSAPYTAAYIAGWSGGDVKKVKASAERVVKTAGSVLAGLASTDSVEIREEVAA